MNKRLNDERKWLHLTLAIIMAFMVSVLPVFVFYLSSVLGVEAHPVVQLVVWWLLVSES